MPRKGRTLATFIPGAREIDPEAEIARLTAARQPRPSDTQKLALLREAVQRVLDDAESQHPGGWGPDVTMVAVLREAMEATA